MKGRFDYVRYDEKSKELQEEAKELVINLESFLEEQLLHDAIKGPAIRNVARALSNLEDLYACIGRAIRDIQVQRGGDDADMMERSSE